jgi:hypothetical protein
MMSRSSDILLKIFQMIKITPSTPSIAFLAIFASIAYVGCGGNSEGTAATSLTKPALIKAADEICEKADKTQNAELNAYTKENPKAQATEAGQVKMVVVAGLPPLKVEIEELAALEAPEGDEDELEAIWSGMEKALKESESDPTTVLTSAGNPFAEVGKVAARYGFKVCNSPL